MASKKWRIRANNGAKWVEAQGDGEFDELVVGTWLHLEELDKGVWGLRLGDLRATIKREKGTVRVDVERGFFQPVRGDTSEFPPPDDLSEE